MMSLNTSTITFLLIVAFWLIDFLQNMQLFKLDKAMKELKETVHILEEEMNQIQNEQDLFSNWLNENDVVIAGVNDSNQKRKASLNAAIQAKYC